MAVEYSKCPFRGSIYGIYLLFYMSCKFQENRMWGTMVTARHTTVQRASAILDYCVDSRKVVVFVLFLFYIVRIIEKSLMV